MEASGECTISSLFNSADIEACNESFPLQDLRTLNLLTRSLQRYGTERVLVQASYNMNNI